MRGACILIFVLVFCTAYSQYNYKYYKVDTLTVKRLENLQNETFYSSVDAKEILYYVKNSDKKYKLVYTFTYWCKPCKEKFPKILSLGKEFDNLGIIYITDLYRGKEFISTENYLKQINNPSPIFSIIDNDRMKDKNGKFTYFLWDKQKNKDVKVNRYDYLIQRLVPNHKDYGYSLILLYDDKNDLVYGSTYKETEDQIFGKIKSILRQ